MEERRKSRGKRADTGEFVYGWFVHDDLIREQASGCILGTKDMSAEGRFECSVVRVVPDTVGQCTGVRDKNGVLIYEHDVLKSEDIKGEVIWHGEEARFALKLDIENEEKMMRNDLGYWAKCVEIVGNIYDTPEKAGGMGKWNG